MYEEVILKEQLFNKIENDSTVAIFGACPAGEKILEDIKKYKKNVNVACFIDNFVQGTFADLPVYNLKEFIDKNLNCNTVIMATINKVGTSVDILRIYDYNVVEQTRFIFNYYRLVRDNIEKIMNLFEKQEDKNLYKLILNVRMGLEDKSVLAKYYHAEFSPKSNFSITSKQYLDKINQNAVKTIFDLGFNNGLNAVAYNKFLPNVEHIYGFDAIYDKCADNTVENFIKNNKLTIIQKCIGSEKGKVNFVINNDFLPQSRCRDLTSMKTVSFENQEIINADIITLDEFCEENNVYPDLIKTDIEGAELPALKGAIKTIKKHRPQLAISIYHSNKDFIEIPVYLMENLENYKYTLGHYRTNTDETVLYAIPNELN